MNGESESLKRKKIELNLHFEKEAISKTKILEIDQESEILSFKLFGTEMDLWKLEKNKAAIPEQKEVLKDEIKFLKQKIDSNSVMWNDLMR